VAVKVQDRERDKIVKEKSAGRTVSSGALQFALLCAVRLVSFDSFVSFSNCNAL
jgi:hypothetical protein